MMFRHTPFLSLILFAVSAPALASDPWVTIHRFSNHYYEKGRKVVVPARCPAEGKRPAGDCVLEAEVVGIRPEKTALDVRFRSGPLKGTAATIPLVDVAIPEGCMPSREFYYCVGMEVSSPGGIQGKIIGVGPDSSVALRLTDGSSRVLAAAVLSRKEPCTNVDRCFAEMEARLWKTPDQVHVKVVDPIHPPQVNDSRDRKGSAGAFSNSAGEAGGGHGGADRAL